MRLNDEPQERAGLTDPSPHASGHTHPVRTPHGTPDDTDTTRSPRSPGPSAARLARACTDVRGARSARVRAS